MPFLYPEAPVTANPAPRIEVVLFDYGMVLSGPPDAAAWSRMRELTGLDEARLHDGYWAFRHDYDRGALTGREYWRAVADRVGVVLNAAQIDALLAADLDLWTQPNPPMIAWAERLQHAGVRTAILSNIGDAIAEGVAARLTWLSGFELCIWSHALSLAKPEPAIFLKAAAALHASPDSILFIDDKEENVAAANAVGMQAVRYANHTGFEREMEKRGFASLLDAGRDSREPARTAQTSEPASA